MAASEKRVNIKVETEANLKNIEALEVKIKELQKQRIQVNIETAERGLEETKAKIAELENKKLELDVDADASEINKIDEEIDKLNYKVLDLQLDVETGELEKAKAEAEELDGTSIDVDVNNITAMEAIDQIGQGFDRLKQGAGEVGEQMGTLLESAGKQETNKTFLEMQLGAEGAATALNDINNIVQKLPGDDTALQGLLSQAAAKNASMTANELENMGVAAADYFSAMSYYGKSATEAQQDMLNYLLAGNTAEIERSPILSQHIDDLKNANTVQERSVALQKALTEEGWGGMSMQDTYNNKLETFNGMLERGKYNLGGMFMAGANGAMDFVMQLDSATGGLVGMGIAAASLASPIGDSLIGLGQMVMGINALRDAEILSAAASKAAAAAQWLLNIAMDANPVMLVVLAITALIAVLSYLYFNNEQVRAAIDGLGQTLMWLAQSVVGSAMSAIQWLSDLFASFTNQMGLNTNDWTQALLGFILFLPQLPIRVGQLLVDTIAKALGFGDNFTNTMINSATKTVNGFINYIKSLPPKLQQELDVMLASARDFAMQIADILTFGGASMVYGWITGSGEHSPGYMYDALLGELVAMTGLPGQVLGELINSLFSIGYEMADALTQTLLGISFDDVINNLSNLVNFVSSSVSGTFNWLSGLFTDFTSQLGLNTNSWTQAVLGFILFLPTLPTQVAVALVNTLARVSGFKGNFVESMVSAAANAVNGFVNNIKQMYGIVQVEFARIESLVSNFITSIPRRVWNLGASIVGALKSALGIGSPGHMYYMFEGELNRLKDLPASMKSKITYAVGSLGTGIVDSFNPTMDYDFPVIETSNADISSNGSNSMPTIINLSFEGCMFDKDERVQEIKDVINKEINWNNITAGRSV